MLHDMKHGEACLLWATSDIDQTVSNIARVSAPENWGADPSKLIKYLIDNKHWSPFEMVNVCVAVKTTRTIGRQMLRHQLKAQEFSQRYAKIDTNNFVVTEARTQDLKNRQNSYPAENDSLNLWWDIQQKNLLDRITLVYKQALDAGIAKEVARNILPEGLTPTTMIFNGYLRNWLHFCEVRHFTPGTQKEASVLAKAIFEILSEVAPITCDAFKRSTGNG